MGNDDPALRALADAAERVRALEPSTPHGVHVHISDVLSILDDALAAAAEAAPLDVERLARAVATVEGHARPSQSWLERVAREYAALRSPDTEQSREPEDAGSEGWFGQ